VVIEQRLTKLPVIKQFITPPLAAGRLGFQWVGALLVDRFEPGAGEPTNGTMAITGHSEAAGSYAAPDSWVAAHQP